MTAVAKKKAGRETTDCGKGYLYFEKLFFLQHLCFQHLYPAAHCFQHLYFTAPKYISLHVTSVVVKRMRYSSVFLFLFIPKERRHKCTDPLTLMRGHKECGSRRPVGIVWLYKDDTIYISLTMLCECAREWCGWWGCGCAKVPACGCPWGSIMALPGSISSRNPSRWNVA